MTVEAASHSEVRPDRPPASTSCPCHLFHAGALVQAAVLPARAFGQQASSTEVPVSHFLNRALKVKKMRMQRCRLAYRPAAGLQAINKQGLSLFGVVTGCLCNHLATSV